MNNRSQRLNARQSELISMVKRRGVTRRWLTTTFLIIALVLIIAAIAISQLVKNAYYNKIEQAVYNEVGINATYFSVTSGVTGVSDFAAAAQGYVEDYDNKDIMELQFLDRGGNILVTSTGFEPDSGELPDYTAALSAENGIGSYIGDNTLGEKVFAATQLLTLASGKEIGAVRVVVSLQLVDRTIAYIVLLLSALSIVVLLLVLLSSLFFFRSIVIPVKSITAGANKIAQGDFSIRLRKDKEDEIGDLVDSINSMAAALATSEQIKNDFISSVSHELRTPLTAIKGWGETIRTCGPEDRDMHDKGLAVIVHEAERLSGLVEDLLDFSRLQSGRMTMNFERLDILAELGEAIYMFSDRASQEQKTITFFEAENLPPVIGDRNRLRQVFVNIIDNAMKYSESGSEIHVAAALDGENIRVMVRDYGCGIAKEDLARVTEKFYKANNTRRGFGIGLGVAKEIISLHGGSIDIASRVGEGTIVTITLPTAQKKSTQ